MSTLDLDNAVGTVYQICVSTFCRINKSKPCETCQKRKFKALKNKLTTVNFSLIHNWPDWLEKQQHTAISKHFTKPAECIRITCGSIFSADV